MYKFLIIDHTSGASEEIDLKDGKNFKNSNPNSKVIINRTTVRDYVEFKIFISNKSLLQAVRVRKDFCLDFFIKD